jgi:hypothetical protein
MSVDDGTPPSIPPATRLNRDTASASSDANQAPQLVETDHAADLRERLADCARLLAIAERDLQVHTDKASERDQLATALATAREERDALLESTSWRLTAPVRALIERVRRLESGRHRSVQVKASLGGAALPASSHIVAPTVFTDPWHAEPPRITLLVDRFTTGTKADGIEHAAAMAAVLAHRLRSSLRIVSRTGPPETAALDRILSRYGLSYDDNPSFDWLAPAGRGAAVGVAANERFVVGSWTDALLARALVSLERVVYVIDQSEVARIRGSRIDRGVRDLFGRRGPALVLADALVSDALRETSLFDRSGTGVTVQVLPTPPSGSDWERIAARLLDTEPRR